MALALIARLCVTCVARVEVVEPARGPAEADLERYAPFQPVGVHAQPRPRLLEARLGPRALAVALARLHVHVRLRADVPQLDRDRAREEVLLDLHREHLGELTQFGWDRTRQLVRVEVEVDQAVDVAEAGRNGPRELVIVELEVGELVELVDAVRDRAFQLVVAQVEVRELRVVQNLGRNRARQHAVKPGARVRADLVVAVQVADEVARPRVVAARLRGRAAFVRRAHGRGRDRTRA